MFTPFIKAALLLQGCAYITDEEYAERTGSGSGGQDCADMQMFYGDGDGDGFGNPDVSFESCDVPEGMVDNADDCDDADPNEYPGATWAVDADGDGYGSDSDAVESCEAIDGTTAQLGDCDDANADINPGAEEDCETEVDDNCSGSLNDLGALGCTDFFADSDEDGFGGSDAACLCDAEAPYTLDSESDCDDTDGSINPDAIEECNDGIDNNCDGTASGCGLLGEREAADADAIFMGVSGGGLAGADIAYGTDITGDGDTDLVVGAYGANSVTFISGPQLGSHSLDEFDHRTPSDLSTKISRDIAFPGDLNGDGNPDLLLGDPSYSITARPSAGAAYLYFGPVTADTDLNVPDVTVQGAFGNSYLGRDLGTIGDLDGDGNDDLMIGSLDAKYGGERTGGVVLVRGPIEPGTLDTALPGSVDVRLFGSVGGDKFGVAVTTPGDVSGDGLPDLVVGARQSNSSSGNVYVFDSSLLADDGSGMEMEFTADEADFIITGVGAGARTGEFLYGPGDINEDGTPDLLVSAPERNLDGTKRGAVYLITELANADITDIAAVEFRGLDNNASFGASLAGTGDVSGAGAQGVAIGAPGSGAGAVFLYAGPFTEGSYTQDDADAQFLGSSSGDKLGSSLLGNLDYDGDGQLDILIGAEGADTSDSNVGMVYVLLGGGL